MPNTTQFERPPYSITSYSVNSGLTESDRDKTLQLGHVTRKTVSEMTYNVSSGTLNSTIPSCRQAYMVMLL